MTNGIVIGLSALAGVWLGWYAVPICLAVVVLVLLCDWNARWRLLAACMVLAGVGAWRSVSLDAVPTSDALNSSTGAIGKVASFPGPSGDGHQMIFSVTEVCINAQCIPASETVVLYATEQRVPIARGQILRVDWRVQSLLELPHGYASFVRSQNATASARADTVRVVQLGPALFHRLAAANASVSSGITDVLSGDTGALATGIVTGNDANLSDEAVANFRSTGTAHITAVSGQNVTIILGFLSMWWQPRSLARRWIFHAVLVAVVWSYASMVGLEAPALRAAVVATLTIFGSHVGRRPDPVTILALTLGTMALIDPLVVHGIGFWLSATASMALCLALPHRLSGRPGRRIAEVAMGPVVASLATMPIVLMAFGTWSPVSILANILIAPVITLAFWVTYPFALLAMVAPGFAGLLAWIPGIILDLVLVIVARLAPLSAQLRVETMSPTGMLALWLPIGTFIWLISNESDRWIRRGHLALRRSSATQ